MVAENQFFDWQIADVCDELAGRGKRVIAAGLDQDFRGEPFPGSKYLLAWAEELIEIKTVCRTGRKATMNARLDEQGNQIAKNSGRCHRLSPGAGTSIQPGRN